MSLQRSRAPTHAASCRLRTQPPQLAPPPCRKQGLNVGGGGGGTAEIRLRLRRASSPGQLMPFQSVLNTMLHELTHNHIRRV